MKYVPSIVPESADPTLRNHLQKEFRRIADLTQTITWSQVEDKPTTFPPEAHTHPYTDVVSVQTNKLLGRSSASTGAAELLSVGSGLQLTAGSLQVHNVPWSSLTGVPSTFTPSAHTHDDRYYTETEIDSTVVKLTGDQTVGGVKTFGDGVGIGATSSTITREDSYSFVFKSGHASVSSLRLRNTGGDNLGSLYASADGIGFTNNVGAWSWRVSNSGNLAAGTVPWARLSGVPSFYAPGNSDNDFSDWNSPGNGLRLSNNVDTNSPSGAGFAAGISIGSGGRLQLAGRYGRLFTRDVPNSTTWNEVWTSGNFTPADYLPLTGGTLTGTLNARSVIPTANNSYDLGSSSLAFRTLHARTSIELGAASDTTLTRLAAGKIGVEGKAVAKHAGSYTSAEITVSTSAPSGGSNGDIWLRV